MRRVLFALCIAVGAVIVGALPAGANTTTYNHNDWFSVAGFQAFVPCTGDTLTFVQGEEHYMYYLTVNDSNFSLTAQRRSRNRRWGRTRVVVATSSPGSVYRTFRVALSTAGQSPPTLGPTFIGPATRG